MNLSYSRVPSTFGAPGISPATSQLHLMARSARLPLASHAARRDDSPPRAPATPALVSPSLDSAATLDVPAFEIKFLLSEAQALEVIERLDGRLTQDPHADPDLNGAYRTTSLYCDTEQYDVFHRVGSCQRRKHRLRHYARTPWVFLERKSKWGERVKKRRTMIPNAELAVLANPMSLVDWPGHWFHRHLMRRGLSPVCRIAYERVALMGPSEQGPVRLTLDRHIRGIMTPEWNVAEFESGLPILTNHVVCEFKYRSYIPTLFKGIIQEMQLTPSPISKYRSYLRARGFVSDRGPRDA